MVHKQSRFMFHFPGPQRPKGERKAVNVSFHSLFPSACSVLSHSFLRTGVTFLAALSHVAVTGRELPCSRQWRAPVQPCIPSSLWPAKGLLCHSQPRWGSSCQLQDFSRRFTSRFWDFLFINQVSLTTTVLRQAAWSIQLHPNGLPGLTLQAEGEARIRSTQV